MVDADRIPIGVEFLGYDARQCSTHMLTHFGFRHSDANRAARIDAVPNRRLKWLSVANFLSAATEQNCRNHGHSDTCSYRANHKAASSEPLRVRDG